MTELEFKEVSVVADYQTMIICNVILTSFLICDCWILTAAQQSMNVTWHLTTISLTDPIFLSFYSTLPWVEGKGIKKSLSTKGEISKCQKFDNRRIANPGKEILDNYSLCCTTLQLSYMPCWYKLHMPYWKRNLTEVGVGLVRMLRATLQKL